MIIRRRSSSLQLITQPQHASLAARIMREWDAAHFPDSPRKASILRAVEQHDNGWDEGNEALVVDEQTGDLIDFNDLPDRLKRDASMRGIERLAHDPYAAALVAQHRLHVYRQYADVSEWRQFFDIVREVRETQLRAARLWSLDQLLRDYSFVRAGDLASLAFCNNWTTAADPDGCSYTMRFDGNTLRLAPDPFAGRTIAIAIDAREIASQRFASAEKARRVLESATVVTLDGLVLGESATDR
jgi:Protein of unknown function (DUF3891)